MDAREFAEAHAAGLVRDGGWTVSLPGQPPFFIHDIEGIDDRGVVVCDTRIAVATYLRAHPGLWKQGEEQKVAAYRWSPVGLAYIADTAARAVDAALLVQLEDGKPEIVLVEELLGMFSRAGIELAPDEKRPAWYPKPKESYTVARGAGRPVFTKVAT